MAATVTTRRRRTAAHRRRRRAAPRKATPALTALARARRSGGPLDNALYRCGCGETFTASVSTTVGCPGCGTTQAW